MARRNVQDGAPLPAGSRLALVASLPALIMLLAGFVVACLIGVRLIGVWKTAILWCVVIGLVAAGVVVLRRAQKDR